MRCPAIRPRASLSSRCLGTDPEPWLESIKGEEIMEYARLLSLFVFFISVAVPAKSEQADPVGILTSELRAHAPAQWEVRVRWRDGQLLATITPWPYQDAFDLWYNLPKLIALLSNLCPAPTEEIWKLLEPSDDVILEPTVGGKSEVDARVSCRKIRFSP